MKKNTILSNFKSTYLLESFSDYFTVLKEIYDFEKNKILWYIGQFNRAWHLKPNLFRYSKETADYFGREIDPLNPNFHFSEGYRVEYPNFVKELDDFKKDVMNEKIKGLYLPKTDFEWLFLGQHYGLLTPLVDFSTDPLIALYFSLDGKYKEEKIKNITECIEEFYEYGYSDDCATVFVFLPGEFNKLSPMKIKRGGKQIDLTIPIKIEDFKPGVFDGYVTRNNVCFEPICIIAPKTNYRIIRQSGNFLCYGDNTMPIDYRTGFKSTLYKIYIPYCIFPEIQNMLKVLNLTHSTVYGEDIYDDIAKKCRLIAKNRFDKAMKNFSERIRNQDKV